jgi:hypothetical protein
LNRRGDAVLGAIQTVSTSVKKIEKISKREDQTEPFETSPHLQTFLQMKET